MRAAIKPSIALMPIAPTQDRVEFIVGEGGCQFATAMKRARPAKTVNNVACWETSRYKLCRWVIQDLTCDRVRIAQLFPQCIDRAQRLCQLGQRRFNLGRGNARL
jgi:hypothetical protein